MDKTYSPSEMHYTEKVIEDALNLEREHKYRKAAANLATVQRAVASDDKQIAKFDEQIKTIDKLLALADTLDNKIQGKGGFLCREAVLSLLNYAHADQVRRRDDREKSKAMLTGALPRMVAEVEQFS